MFPEVRRYLASVSWHSKLDAAADGEIVRELQSHLQDEIEELCEAGLSADEAVDLATSRFGSAKEIGREIYEVYSAGTWSQALLAAIPHLLLAAMFAMHLWRDSFWLIVLPVIIGGVSIWGWVRGKPPWVFPWLGYLAMILLVTAFLVVLVIGRALTQFVLSSNGLWVASLVYVGISLCLLGFIVLRVVRRDWLLASLMMLPFPAIFVWTVALEREVGLVEYARQGSAITDHEVALSFLAVGAAAFTFIRFRRRLVKTGVVSLGTLLILAMIWRYTDSGFNSVACFFITAFLVCLVMSPRILEHGVAHRRRVEIGETSVPDQLARRT